MPADIWLGLLDRQRWAVRSNQRRPLKAAASNPANFCLSRSTQQHHSQADAESHTKTIIRQPDNSSTVTEFINSQHNHLAAAQPPPLWRTIPTEVGPALRISPAASSCFCWSRFGNLVVLTCRLIVPPYGAPPAYPSYPGASHAPGMAPPPGLGMPPPALVPFFVSAC